MNALFDPNRAFFGLIGMKVLHVSLMCLLGTLSFAQDFDKAAEDLRLATRHLGMLVGKVDVEEILGSIFNDFCIGK